VPQLGGAGVRGLCAQADRRRYRKSVTFWSGGSGLTRGMTKKIGVSLRQELYDWAAREVEEGRAESVSALIAEGLELLEARAQLEAVVTELHREAGELDDQAKARLAEALAAADEAYRRHRSSSAGHAA
jgi:Arc/MetJ-type ribon-helix-helix transcriptional regulator